MPRKVNAYSCEFGCKRRVLTNKSAMARHEETCFFNPARRACITCEHEDPQTFDSPDYAAGYSGGIEGRGCAKDMLYRDEKAQQDIMFDCSEWKIKSLTRRQR